MDSYIQSLLKEPSPSIPLIVDEALSLEIVSSFSGTHITSLDDCKTGSIHGVLLYEKEEEKQSLSIKQIRDAIINMSERPYEGKMLVLFRDFDSASIEAMNASLKILEEPPAYAIILLVVSNPENVIETIRSRTLTFFSKGRKTYLESDIENALSSYNNGDEVPLIKIVSSRKLEKDEAIAILEKMSSGKNSPTIESIESAIQDLMSVNESPRNILDRVILTKSMRGSLTKY